MNTIIFLNGCSSSGKTSISRSIQHLSERPWLHLGIDTFINMMPDKYMGFGEKAHEGCAFVRGQNEYGPTISCKIGFFGENFFKTCPKLAGILADAGHDLIIDEVLLKNDGMLMRYCESLTNHKVYFIQVNCDLPIMQEREILRRDRAIGLANDQYVSDEQRIYDYQVDTTNTSSFVIARNILDFIDQNPFPTAFKKFR